MDISLFSAVHSVKVELFTDREKLSLNVKNVTACFVLYCKFVFKCENFLLDIILQIKCSLSCFIEEFLYLLCRHRLAVEISLTVVTSCLAEDILLILIFNALCDRLDTLGLRYPYDG